MSSILGQLSVAIGGLVFIISMIIALSNGVPMLSAILRSFAAMCLTSMVAAIFFRFFTGILYHFVSDRLKEQAAATHPPEDKGKEKTTPNSPPGGVS